MSKSGGQIEECENSAFEQRLSWCGWERGNESWKGFRKWQIKLVVSENIRRKCQEFG